VALVASWRLAAVGECS